MQNTRVRFIYCHADKQRFLNTITAKLSEIDRFYLMLNGIKIIKIEKIRFGQYLVKYW